MKPRYRTGIVREVDGNKGLVKVEFQDQDNMSSWWLNVNQPLASESKSYSMPEVGAQVNCLTDERGEEGTVLGAFYSDQDTPPTDNPDEIKTVLSGGRDETYNKKTGEYNLKQEKSYTIEIGAAKVLITPDSIHLTVGGTGIKIGKDGQVKSTGDFTHDGNAHFINGYLRHNAKNVGDDHIHNGVEPGGGTTREPAN